MSEVHEKPNKDRPLNTVLRVLFSVEKLDDNICRANSCNYRSLLERCSISDDEASCQQLCNKLVDFNVVFD